MQGIEHAPCVLPVRRPAGRSRASTTANQGRRRVRAALAIVYLGTIGTAVGFVLYYYVLKHMDVSRVSLITLITPVCAIALGYSLNEEPISRSLVLGTVCILSGLFCYQFGHSLRKRLFATT